MGLKQRNLSDYTWTSQGAVRYMAIRLTPESWDRFGLHNPKRSRAAA